MIKFLKENFFIQNTTDQPIDQAGGRLCGIFIPDDPVKFFQKRADKF
jgi:hypothetical protein